MCWVISPSVDTRHLLNFTALSPCLSPCELYIAGIQRDMQKRRERERNKKIACAHRGSVYLCFFAFISDSMSECASLRSAGNRGRRSRSKKCNKVQCIVPGGGLLLLSTFYTYPRTALKSCQLNWHTYVGIKDATVSFVLPPSSTKRDSFQGSLDAACYESKLNRSNEHWTSKTEREGERER